MLKKSNEADLTTGTIKVPGTTLELQANNLDAIEELALSDSSKAELNALYSDLTDKFKEGKVVTGTIVSKDSGGVLVDINYKSNGMIPNYEFSDFELKRLSPNDTIEVLLDRFEDEHGSVVLSYQKAKSIRAWDKISDLATADEPVCGMVTHKVKGGLSVDIGIPAFLPGSQVDVQRVVNFDDFVGKEVSCKILKINRKRGNVIISRRKYLEEQRMVDKRRVLDTIQQDQVLQGVVKNITNYGAFVDVGGVDGLLHITDMSWGRINHPSELVKIGDTITVKIISFDKNHEKISLGMKQLRQNPWEEVQKRYPIGAAIKGRISSITDYGLFVEIEKGVEGLVHISEISWTERITNLSKHFTVGAEVNVVVVAVDKENRRMSLSIKQLHEDPWRMVAERFKVGDKISGRVTNITDFGVFVQLHEGVDGLVHVSDISWTEHISHPSDRYKKGDSVEAIILSMDIEHKKISLGIKQLKKDPWEAIEEYYPVGKIVEGTVSKIANFGAFIKLTNGVEGLVHISELDNKEVEKAEDILKVGQVEQFKVIKVNKEDRKLGLSLRAVKYPHLVFTPSSEGQSQDRSKGAMQKKGGKKGGNDSADKGGRGGYNKGGNNANNVMINGALQQALQDFRGQQKSAHESTDDNEGDE